MWVVDWMINARARLALLIMWLISNIIHTNTDVYILYICGASSRVLSRSDDPVAFA